MKSLKFIFAVLAGGFLSFSIFGQPQHLDIKKITPSFIRYAEKAMAETNTPGMAIAIVQGDQVIFSGGFGVRKIGGEDKVDKNTIFQIGSISKSFTTALLAQQVDAQQIHWDGRVIDILPDFRMFDPYVTREFRIDDLAAQRTGMPEHAADFMSFAGYSREDIIRSLRYVIPVSSFRLKYAYQNALFLVAAKILEKKSGISYEQLLKEKLFNPMSMNNTTVTLDDYLATKNKAWIHHQEGKTEAYPENWPYFNWSYLYAPAGGINSDIADMSKWTIMQMNNGRFNGKQIVSSDSIKRMHQPNIFAGALFDANSYYAFGWVYRSYAPYPIIWHNGETMGAHNMIAFIPQANIGIVILTNTTGTGLPEALAFEFFDRAFHKPEQDWVKKLTDHQNIRQKQEEMMAPNLPKVILPSLELSSYTGTYFNEMYGNVSVAAENGHLVLTIGPKKVKLILKHWYRDIFSVIWPGMNESGESKVYFSLDASGKPNQLQIDMLGNNLEGLFTKT